MPRICTICSHGERETIDLALLDRQSYRTIAARFDTSTAALQRHRSHIRQDLAKVSEATGAARSGRLLDSVHAGEGRAERMYAAAEGILERSMEASDLRTALQAIRAAAAVMAEARAYMELRGELSGELGKQQNVFPDARIIVTPMVAPAAGIEPRSLLETAAPELG